MSASSGSSDGTSSASRTLALIVLALAVGVSAWALTRNWTRSLRDSHEFRQLQTALTAYYLKQDGLRLNYETPVLGPPWSIPMEFPTYQATVAVLSRVTGLSLESAGRLLSVLFFYATLPAVWLLLRPRLPGQPRPWLVIASILVCPLYLFYSRAFMIESTALCLAAWFLYFLDRTFATWRALPAVWVIGALAAATKVTTFGAFWIAGLLVLLEKIADRRRQGERWITALARPGFAALAATIVPLLAGAAWVAYSDHLKSLNPYGSALTSDSLRTFNLGTLEQRLSFDWWRRLGITTLSQVIAWPAAIVLAISAMLSPPAHRRLLLACLLCFPGGLLLFSNLYYVHDYYSYASALFPLAALGIATAGMLQNPRVPRALGPTLLFVALGSQVGAFLISYERFFHAQPAIPPPPEARILQAITPPEDVFVGIGFDWASTLPYYSERRGIVPFLSHARDLATLDRSLAQLGRRQIATLAVSSSLRSETGLTDSLIAKLKLAPYPIARTHEMDLYVRIDLAASAVAALAARNDWDAEVDLAPDRLPSISSEQHEVRGSSWDASSIASPLPLFSRGPYPVSAFHYEDVFVLQTQAPTELHFSPSPGASRIAAVTGMLSSAYTPPNRTPGVRIVVFEELPDGTRRRLFDRSLAPATEPADRGDIAIAYEQPEPFAGKLVFAHYSAPSGNLNCAWSYWKRIEIR